MAKSEDRPMVIEIVDEDAKINVFLDTLEELFERAGCGELIIMENACYLLQI